MSGGPRTVDEVEEVVTLLQLQGMVTYELSGRRRDGAQPEDGSNPESDFAQDVEGGYEMQVFVHEDERTLSVRLRIELSTEHLVGVTSDIAAQYSKAESFDLGSVALTEFVTGVAVMQLFPYVRQEINDLTSRLGAPVILPVLKRSDIRAGSD